jgi:hypothetical protein
MIANRTAAQEQHFINSTAVKAQTMITLHAAAPHRGHFATMGAPPT